MYCHLTVAYQHVSNQHLSQKAEPWHLPHSLLPPRILFCLTLPSKGCPIKRPGQFSLFNQWKQHIERRHSYTTSVSWRMSVRLFHEARILKHSLTFRQVQQSFFCWSSMSSSYSTISSSAGKSKWLAQVTNQFHKEPLWCPSSSWSKLVWPWVDAF